MWWFACEVVGRPDVCLQAMAQSFMWKLGGVVFQDVLVLCIYGLRIKAYCVDYICLCLYVSRRSV